MKHKTTQSTQSNAGFWEGAAARLENRSVVQRELYGVHRIVKCSSMTCSAETLNNKYVLIHTKYV